MRPLLAICVLGLLAACGADGEPERPEPRRPIDISVSGTAEIGIHSP
ncbi:hypothetical protein [Salipiger mucosus]|uniref:Uncharacterized protein n=1 Tax=Salipiger mucosus DSM 16094 TaxID=1123237 RepID=S9QMW1_9RHOB|nr:hypothetical protein [Salipiger mucosus]EPX82796.1 hypothetical protein Salmuc_05149 [Salipiger mucosus DSM 16094]